MSHRLPVLLNVDDDPVGRSAVTRVLQRSGFAAREAATGREALALARTSPDLILLDVNLPDLNGFEVCERLKADPATRSIPILFISGAFVDPQDRARGLEEGGDGYLTKPVEPTELLAYVKALLRPQYAVASARDEQKWIFTLLDNIREPFVVLNRDWHLAFVSNRCAQLLRKDLGELSGRALWEVLRCGEDSAFFKRLQHAMTERAASEFEEFVPGLAGRFAVRVSPYEDGLVVFLDNLTDRDRLEEPSHQAPQLELGGQLADAAAERLNNLLTYRESLQSKIVSTYTDTQRASYVTETWVREVLFGASVEWRSDGAIRVPGGKNAIRYFPTLAAYERFLGRKSLRWLLCVALGWLVVTALLLAWIWA